MDVSLCERLTMLLQNGKELTFSTFGEKHGPDGQECKIGNCKPSPLGPRTFPVLTPRPTATDTCSPSRVYYNQLGESGTQRCSGTDSCQARKSKNGERTSDGSVNVADREYLTEEVNERFVVTGRTVNGNKGGSDMGRQGHVG